MSKNGLREAPLPPHDIAAEQAVLGSLLIDRDAIIKVAPLLSPDDFYREAHAQIYAASGSLYEAGTPVDNTTLCHQLEKSGQLADIGGEAYIAELITIPSTAQHIESYAAIVKRMATLRKALDLFGKGAVAVYDKNWEGLATSAIELQELIARDSEVLFSETGGELLQASFPGWRWRIEGIIPDGAFQAFAAKPKAGKGYFSLQMAQAVVYGIPFLGRQTVQGRVLFLALEDGRRRIQKRLQEQGAILPLQDLIFIYNCPPLDTMEGFLRLSVEIDRHRPNLVIIDTLSGSKSGQFDENTARDMAPIMNRLRRLAQEKDIAIWGNFHHKKLISGDALLDLRGSSAISAAVDGVAGLYRDRSAGHYILSIEGRDIPETSLRLTWDTKLTMCWQCEGDATELATTDAEEDVLDALEDLGEADAGAVAKELGKSRQTVNRTLKGLREKGRVIERAEKGKPGRPRLIYTPQSDVAKVAKAAFEANVANIAKVPSEESLATLATLATPFSGEEKQQDEIDF